MIQMLGVMIISSGVSLYLWLMFVRWMIGT